MKFSFEAFLNRLANLAGPVQWGSAESLKKHIKNSRGLRIQQVTSGRGWPTETAAESAANITSGQVVLEKYIGLALVVQRSNRRSQPVLRDYARHEHPADFGQQ